MVDILTSEKRFSISSESLTGFKKIRAYIKERSMTDPRFIGASFVGSRIHGLEHPQSDFDTVLFYDGSDFEFPANTGQHDYLQVTNRLMEGRKTYIANLRREAAEMMTRHNYVVSSDTSGTILVIDASEEATKRDFENFKSEVKLQFGEGSVDGSSLYADPSSFAFPLASRFFLGVGDKLIKSREQVLLLFEQEPKGDLLFKNFIEYLQHFERTSRTKKRLGLVPYQQYPTTLKEARRYFLM